MSSQSDVEKIQYLSLVEGITRECTNYNAPNEETIIEFIIDLANHSESILVCFLLLLLTILLPLL